MAPSFQQTLVEWLEYDDFIESYGEGIQASVEDKPCKHDGQDSITPTSDGFIGSRFYYWGRDCTRGSGKQPMPTHFSQAPSLILSVLYILTPKSEVRVRVRNDHFPTEHTSSSSLCVAMGAHCKTSLAKANSTLLRRC